MIIGKNSILAYFESVGHPYFAIFAKGQVEKGNAIFRNDKDEEKTFDFTDAKMTFENTLNLLSYGDYSLVLAPAKNVTTRGGNRVDFKIGLDEGKAAPAPAPLHAMAGIGAVTIEEVERKANEIADKRFRELMDKKELAEAKAKLAELEKENREYEKKINEPWNKFLNAAAPHSEHIIAGLFGGNKAQQANVVLSGVQPTEVGEADPQAQQVVEDFVQALAAAKPHNWLQIVQQLTALIKDNPAKFETALNFL